jgi:hypothetical protein
MERIFTPGEIRQRIIRQINNNLLQTILEYVGFEQFFKTIFKINSNFKNFAQHIYQNQNDHLSKFKKVLFEDNNRNVKETLVLFDSFYKNKDQNWEFATKLMSNFLFNQISDSKSLKLNLDLNRKSIGTDEFLIISKALKLNTTLKEIHLGWNDLSDEGAKYISDALKLITTLTVIYLNNNKISDEGAKYISDALKLNTTLKEIHLWNNEISDEGAKYISDALKLNTTLTVIYLNNNEISDEGAKYISDALKLNTTLTMISLHHNKISDEGAKYISEP